MRRSAAVAVALALVAAGCAARHETGVTTLRFWAMGREGEVVQELVRDFEREHPGIRVEVQSIPWTAAHEKLLTAHVGGSTPDVAQLGNTWIAEFTALDAIAPLPAALDSLRRHGFEGIWETNVIDGVTRGVPWYVDTRVLFYRRDLLEQAGYRTMPQTWAEWRAAMVAIKRMVGPDRFAIFLPTNEFAPEQILGAQAGSSLLGDGGTRGVFSGPEFRRAFDFYLDLFRSGLAPPIGYNEISNMYQEFERGYFAMTITGPWNLGEFRRRLPEALQDDWATAPMPGPDGPGVSLAGGASLVVFRGSHHPEAAWQLVEFLQRPEQQIRFYELTGDLPARVEAWRDSALASDPQLAAFAEQLTRVVPSPQVPEWELVARKLQDTAERVVRGKAEPSAALAALDRDVYQLLEKRRWMLGRARPSAAGVGAGR